MMAGMTGFDLRLQNLKERISGIWEQNLILGTYMEVGFFVFGREFSPKLRNQIPHGLHNLGLMNLWNLLKKCDPKYAAMWRWIPLEFRTKTSIDGRSNMWSFGGNTFGAICERTSHFTINTTTKAYAKLFHGRESVLV